MVSQGWWLLVRPNAVVLGEFEWAFWVWAWCCWYCLVRVWTVSAQPHVPGWAGRAWSGCQGLSRCVTPLQGGCAVRRQGGRCDDCPCGPRAWRAQPRVGYLWPALGVSGTGRVGFGMSPAGHHRGGNATIVCTDMMAMGLAAPPPAHGRRRVPPGHGKHDIRRTASTLSS